MSDAKLLSYSISPSGKKIATFEIYLPKVLLAEYNTHSLIARNFSSSRAIPVGRNTEIESFYPQYWGKNQAGMVAKDEEIDDILLANEYWDIAISSSKYYSKKLSDLGLHKQWANRLNDWHTMAKGVTTATEWKNFLWLRNAEDAQPEIKELAEKIEHLLESEIPMKLSPGEWHLPYIETSNLGFGIIYFDPVSEEYVDLETAKMLSTARCAAISYRTEDVGIEKAQDIYTKLFSGNKVHSSPAMHQATPMLEWSTFEQGVYYMQATEGVTHVDKKGNCWSGNLQGWIQQRQLLPNHYVGG